MRLTRQDRKAWNRRFQEIQTPGELAGLVEQLFEQVGTEFFTQAGLAFVREAWVAAQHGLILGADCARLSTATDYDCEVITAGMLQKYEITEADQIGRRRGDEYSLGKEEGIRRDPFEEVRKRASQSSRMLQSAINKKLSKKYPADVGLIVYLNLMEYGWFEELVEKAISEQIKMAMSTFEIVDVHWQDRVFRMRHGQSDMEVFRKQQTTV